MIPLLLGEYHHPSNPTTLRLPGAIVPPPLPAPKELWPPLERDPPGPASCPRAKDLVPLGAHHPPSPHPIAPAYRHRTVLRRQCYVKGTPQNVQQFADR